MPVVDSNRVLLGIITNRDMRFETDPNKLVGAVMTPMPLVTAPVGTKGTTRWRCWPGTRSRNCR